MRESFYCDSLIFHGFKTNDISKGDQAREETQGGWKAEREPGKQGGREQERDFHPSWKRPLL